MNLSNLICTRDGSHTLFHPQTGEHYHSTFGAIQESEHIFIKAGLETVQKPDGALNILEIGMGTGLNALLTMRWAENHHQLIRYTGVEAFPPDYRLLEALNYPGLLKIDRKLFLALYASEAQRNIQQTFQFQWIHQKYEDFLPETSYYHLVYFDAFSPVVQPEMWTEHGFVKLFDALKPSGVLTTYSCKGTVKRALKTAGFTIEKLPGPPGKREFLRARVSDR